MDVKGTFYPVTEENKLTIALLDCVILKTALRDIAKKIFSPAEKHGYMDDDLNQAIEQGNVLDAIKLLEKKFYLILSEYEIEL